MSTSGGADDELITTGEAAKLLGLSDDTARRYFDDGLLSGQVLAKRHRRVSRVSAEALASVLRMPPGPDRDAAMEQMRHRNRGGASPQA